LSPLLPGDTLYVRGGTYVERIQNPPITAGTSSAPIVVSAYPGERPVIQGLLWITGASYWTFDGIDVTWDLATGQPSEHMVKFTNGVGWTFKDAEVWGAHSYAGIYVASTVIGEPSGWTIAYNCVHDTYQSNGDNQDHLLYVDSGVGSTSGTVTRNILFNALNGEGVKLAGGTVTTGSAHVSVSYNTVYMTKKNVLVGWESHDNDVYGNILDQSNDGQTFRGYQLDPILGVNNTVHENVWFGASSLIYNDPAPYQPINDTGKEINADPQCDSVADCEGFHPNNTAVQGYGRYAPEGPPSPSPSPTPTPSPSPSPTPTPTQPGPAIEFKSGSSATNGTATSIAMDPPSGILPGDFLVAVIDVRGAPIITSPPNWTSIRTDVNGYVMVEASFYHFVGSSEPASYVWTFSSSQSAAGGILAYRGVSSQTPVGASSGLINTTWDSAMIVAPSVTTSVQDAVVVGLFGIAKNTSVAPPPSLQERLDVANSGGRYKIGFEESDFVEVLGAATGDEIATSARAGANIGQLVLLMPASA